MNNEIAILEKAKSNNLTVGEMVNLLEVNGFTKDDAIKIITDYLKLKIAHKIFGLIFQ